jgi:HK97 family phage major capsid protein
MKEKFQAWCKLKSYEIKDDVMNEDGTVKEAGTSAEDMASYFNEYNSEVQKELSDKLKEDITEANKEAIAKAVEELSDTLREGQIEQMKELNAQLATQGMAIKNVIDAAAANDVSMTSKGSLEGVLKASEEALKTMQGTNDGKVTLKVVGDMTIAGNVSGGDLPQAQREPGVNNIAKRRTFIRELVNNAVATSNVIEWVEQQNQEGAVGGTAEGILKNQIDFDLVVVSQNIKKRTGFIKASTEMLGDISFMQSEIENELFTELALDIDNQILNGDDAGQNLNGILTQATAWAAGVYALTVNQANLVDVLTVAATQIEVANFMATVHVVHPQDLTTLRLIKAAADVQYVDRLIDVNGTLTLDGVRVVSNTGIAQDNFLTMDGSKDTVFSRGEITIQVGLDSDDFTKNMRTILAEWRGLNRIKGNDTGAFVTGVISTSITALETV